MHRIEMNKRLTMRPEVPDGRYLGRLRGMLVFLEGDVGDDLLTVMLYQDLPGKVRYSTRSTEKYQPIAELALAIGYFKNAYHVDIMRVDYRFQGHGIAPLLYRYVLRKLGIVIQAGHHQSPGGRKIWANLAKMKDVLVFASYRRGKELFELDVDEDYGELTCEKAKLYDGYRSVYTFAVAAA